MGIGTLIKSARKKSGLTQEQSAEALNISRQTLSNWENGKTYPDIISVIKMSDLYSVSLDYLLKEETSMKQTYKEYLEESTNTVKSRERNAKLLLILVTLGIWALSIIFIGLVYTGVDAKGYSLIVTWMVLPVTFFVASVVVGRYNYFNKFKWLFALSISLIYTLSSYATAVASQNAINNSNMWIMWPSFTKFPIGLFISFAGLGIGLLIRKRVQTAKCEE